MLIRRWLGIAPAGAVTTRGQSAPQPAQPLEPAATRSLPVPPLSILFVGHDAAQAGSQMVLLHLMRWLGRHAWTRMHLLLLEGGDLLPAFRPLAPMMVLAKDLPPGERLEVVRRFCGGRVDLIYGNSAVAAQAYGWLGGLEAPIVTHVHELEQSLRRFADHRTLRLMLRHTHHYIAASLPVLDNLVSTHGIDRDRGSVVHAFIEPLDEIPLGPAETVALRQSLGVNDDGILIFGCGTRDWRKGADLFVEVARRVVGSQATDAYFYWIGDGTDGRIPVMEHLIDRYGLRGRIQLLQPHPNPRALFRAGDIFLLPSREDPFPLVCLEAAECRLPIICFADAGGMSAFVADEIGFVVPFEDVAAMAEKVELLARLPDLRARLGAAAREKLLATHVSDHEAPRILALCRELAGRPHPLSVIVPNYNCAPWLRQRFDSIFSQTFRDFETLILDDASTDASHAIIDSHAGRAAVRLSFNERNSGNPFAQWQKGLEMARGELVWVAESDDFCEPGLLDALLARFTDERVALAYCQSMPVGPDGEPLGPDYLAWTDDLDPERWRHAYRAAGQDELNLALAHKNAIINASAVIMRRSAALAAVAAAIPFRFAGDWVTYAGIAWQGDVAFVPETLNRHRRHPAANTSKMIGTLDWLAEDLTVKGWFIRQGWVRGNPALQSLCRTIATYERDVRWRIPGEPDLSTDPSLRAERELARTALETACGGPAWGESVLLVAAGQGNGWLETARRAGQLAAGGQRVFVVSAAPERDGRASAPPFPAGGLWLEGSAGPLRWYDRFAGDRSGGDAADMRQCRLRTLVLMCRLLKVNTILSGGGPVADRLAAALSESLAGSAG